MGTLYATLEELYTERTGPQTHSDRVHSTQFLINFLAIQIAELLKCMLSHTGDLGSRLDTLDDIDTEKTVHIPKLLHSS